MKKRSLTLFLSVFTTICFGQSLFFDNLNNSSWTSASRLTDSIIRGLKEIPLERLRVPKDSLHVYATIWSFKDGMLSIVYYDHKTKQETQVASYAYEVPAERSLLILTPPDKQTLNYAVGITSTGTYAMLTKKKVKKKK